MGEEFNAPVEVEKECYDREVTPESVDGGEIPKNKIQNLKTYILNLSKLFLTCL